MPRDRVDLLCYGPIGGWFGLTAQDVALALRQAPEAREIVVRIHSEGGDALDGLAICSALRSHAGRKVVCVEGLAASAASVILAAGDEVVMSEGALVMLHNPWAVAMGDGEALRQQADVLDALGRAYAAEYSRKTGKSPDEMRALMAKNNWQVGAWLTAPEAQAFGLVDRIGPPVQMQARAVPARAGAHPALAAFAAAAAAPFTRSSAMTKKEALDKLRAAAADNADLQQAVAELDKDKEPDGDEVAKAKADAAQARKDADQVRYEALIGQAKADAGSEHARKIRGPAHEKRVRDQYPTLQALQGYLAAAEPGPELQPHQAAASGGVATDHYHDTRFQRALATAGVDTRTYAQHKAATAAPTVRSR